MKTKLPPKLPVENQAFKLLKVTYQWSKNPVNKGNSTILSIYTNFEVVQTSLSLQESDQATVKKVDEKQYVVTISSDANQDTLHFSLEVSEPLFSQKKVLQITLGVILETDETINNNVAYSG